MDVEMPDTEKFQMFVLAAFDEDEEGSLHPAFAPQQIESEQRAISLARSMTAKHDGVVVWRRAAIPSLGEYGPPEILFQSGHIPKMG
jgi:hypothetical protein